MKFILALLILISSVSFPQQVYTNYYENGKIESEITYADSIREGVAKFYYENGNLKEERTYVNGRVEGLVKIYNENGILQEVVNIENGKREGPSSLFNDEGVYVSDIYFVNGKRENNSLPNYVRLPSEVASNDVKTEEKFIPQKKIIKPKQNSLLPPSNIDEETFADDPAVFLTAEVPPEPVGGMDAVYKKIVYPELAEKNNIQGTVKIEVSINEYGDVLEANVIEGIGYGCDEAARFAVYYAKFKPAMLKGNPVKMKTIIPVEFKLGKKTE